MSQAGHAGLQALGVLRVKLEAAKAYSMRDDKEPDTEAIVCDMRDKELKKAVATLPLRVCCDSLRFPARGPWPCVLLLSVLSTV